MIGTILVLIAAACAAAVVICWSDIVSYLRVNKLKESDITALYREKLRNGNVRVSAKIFENAHTATAHHEHTWEGESMDAETEELFGEQDEVEVVV